jgi:hypothetical protein
MRLRIGENARVSPIRAEYVIVFILQSLVTLMDITTNFQII